MRVNSLALVVLQVLAAFHVGTSFLAPLPQSRATNVIVYSEPPKNDFFDFASRFYNELVPWGDPSKGFQTMVDKRNAMVVKYMQKTGCSKEEAEKEVDEYLADKEGYVKRKRAEEAAAKASKKA